MAEENNLNDDILETKTVTIDKIHIEGYKEVTTKKATNKRKSDHTLALAPNSRSSPSDREENGSDITVGSESSPERSASVDTSEHGSSYSEVEDLSMRRVTDAMLNNQPKLPSNRFKAIENPCISYDLISEYAGIRGYGIIFVNHFTGANSREGADEDVKLLYHLFKNLGLMPFVCENKTAKEMLDIVDSYKDNKEPLSKFGCLFLAISTHGGERDVIYGNDGIGIELSEIVSRFDNDRCPPMIGKPKVFLVQACRGVLKDHQVVEAASPGERRGPTSVKYPVTSAAKQDCLLAFASNPGYKARRDECGSWFFQALYHAYKQYGNTHPDFEQILKLTNRLLIENFSLEEGNRLQPCHVSSNLTKLLLMPYQPKRSEPHH